MAQQVAFDPAERIHAQPFQTGISVAARLGGLAQAAGGAVEATVGVFGAPNTAGVSQVLTVHGLDQYYAGIVTAVSGEGAETFTYNVTKATAMKAGLSENTAGWIAFGLDNGISLGADFAAVGKLAKAGRVGGVADELGGAASKNFDQLNALAKQTTGHGVGLEILNDTCFVAGTPLLTPDGSRRIEDFQPGDAILSRSELDPDGDVLVAAWKKSSG